MTSRFDGYRLLLVGGDQGTEVAGSLAHVASGLSIDWTLARASEAFSGSRWRRAIGWHLLGHRPLKIAQFSEAVVAMAKAHQASHLLCAGLSPVLSEALRELGRAGVRRLAFLTDDPWAKDVRSAWYMRSLREYDHVFTPRRSNIAELKLATPAEVSYLPFGYDERYCYPSGSNWYETSSIPGLMESNVLFVGGADPERLAALRALLDAGVSVVVCGSGFDGLSGRGLIKLGQTSIEAIRELTWRVPISLIMPRRINRDGHVMRTIEAAAMGGCLLAERTPEHAELLGLEGDGASYFGSHEELISQVKRLLANPERRARMRLALVSHMDRGRHRYSDRLQSMLLELNLHDDKERERLL